MAEAGRSQSVELRKRIDRICDRFEADWRAGKRPRLEVWLHLIDDDCRDELLAELLTIEVDSRRQQGESPTIDEYARRFESDQHTIETTFEQGDEESRRQDRSTFDTKGDMTGSSGKRRRPRKPRGKVPRELGRYRIDKQIGAGAMGTVLLAEDTMLGRPVALKIPHISGTDDDELLERFEREARTAAMLRHPNICPIYDVGEAEGIRYISMAWIDGVPLTRHVNDVGLSEQQIVFLIEKLARALHNAHQNGVVHRDLKPANIMVDRRGDPIVMDFGLAMHTEQIADVRLTQTGAQMGSPAYMSPEQVDGDTSLIGPASDIYGLGIVLYELLTGNVPFDGPTASVLAQIIMKDPEPPSKMRLVLSAELEAICLRMIAKRPEDRYASMADVASALSECTNTSPRQATNDSEPAPRQPEPAASEPTVSASRPDEIRKEVEALIHNNDLEVAQRLLESLTTESSNHSNDDLLHWAHTTLLNVQMQRATSIIPGKAVVSRSAMTPADEVELRMLMVDISEAFREKRTDGLLEKVQRALEIQPDNQAMRKLELQLRSPPWKKVVSWLKFRRKGKTRK